ncbi:TonB-dependent receptor, partial [bacterium]|nr:TonB-dependent receptor [bacterium]
MQDEFDAGKFSFVLGVRVDKFSVIDKLILSPRISAVYEPVESHAIRVSFNRAFRSPSLINNFLENEIRNTIVLPGLNRSFTFPILAIGNEDLLEESLTAYEVGYIGEIRGLTRIGMNYYYNFRDDNINFTPVQFYGPDNPPPGWPLPPNSVPAGVLPSVFSFLNLGPISNQGIEFSIERILNENFSAFANYSWQDDPKIETPDPDQIPYPVQELSFPPAHRFNIGLNYIGFRFLGSLFINYTDEAFWTDILDSRFH